MARDDRTVADAPAHAPTVADRAASAQPARAPARDDTVRADEAPPAIARTTRTSAPDRGIGWIPIVVSVVLFVAILVGTIVMLFGRRSTSTLGASPLVPAEPSGAATAPPPDPADAIDQPEPDEGDRPHPGRGRHRKKHRHGRDED